MPAEHDDADADRSGGVGEANSKGRSTDAERTGRPSVDRTSPVGEPVIRGDADILGERAADAVAFDPDDPDSRAEAAAVVAEFATATRVTDPLVVLRGAAACAALVRGEGSYKAASARAGGDVGVTFIRKWARVHDLPYAIRRHVAVGDIAPSAAKHIARVDGDARFVLAWAALDEDLTVRQLRSIASAVNDGTPVADAVASAGVEPGRFEASLPVDEYVELRRRAALSAVDPSEVVAAALATYFDRTDAPTGARRGPFEH